MAVHIHPVPKCLCLLQTDYESKALAGSVEPVHEVLQVFWGVWCDGGIISKQELTQAFHLTLILPFVLRGWTDCHLTLSWDKCTLWQTWKHGSVGLWRICWTTLGQVHSLASLHSMCQMIGWQAIINNAAFCVFVKWIDHTEQIGRALNTIEDVEQSVSVDKIKGICQVSKKQYPEVSSVPCTSLLIV